MKARLSSLISRANIDRCGLRHYPVLSMTMHDGLVLQSERFKKEVASRNKSQYKVVRRGQLVVGFPIDEGVLAAQEATDRGIVSPAYDIWDIEQSLILPKYLELSLRSERAIEYYKAKLKGTTARRRSIRKDDFLSMSINVPTIDQQHLILNRMKAIEGLLAKWQSQSDSFDELVKSRFIEMFGPNEGSVRLSTVCTLYNGDRGKNYPSGKDRVEEGIPFVNAGDLVNGRISFEKMDYITEERYKLLSGGKIERGDILYCLRGTLGKCAITDFSGGTIASSMMIIRPNQNKVLPAYLYQVLASPLVEKQLQSSRNGSTQPNLSAKSVGNYVIPLPHINRQREFTDFVARIDKLRFDTLNLNNVRAAHCS